MSLQLIKELTSQQTKPGKIQKEFRKTMSKTSGAFRNTFKAKFSVHVQMVKLCNNSEFARVAQVGGSYLHSSEHESLTGNPEEEKATRTVGIRLTAISKKF
jgi:hypothetical protein